MHSSQPVDANATGVAERPLHRCRAGRAGRRVSDRARTPSGRGLRPPHPPRSSTGRCPARSRRPRAGCAGRRRSQARRRPAGPASPRGRARRPAARRSRASATGTQSAVTTITASPGSSVQMRVGLLASRSRHERHRAPCTWRGQLDPFRMGSGRFVEPPAVLLHELTVVAAEKPEVERGVGPVADARPSASRTRPRRARARPSGSGPARSRLLDQLARGRQLGIAAVELAVELAAAKLGENLADAR